MRLPAATVTFTTRRGGVSEGPYESLNLGILTDDQPDRVLENRRIAAGLAGVDDERIAMGWQVHGTDIRDWTGIPPDPGYAHPVAGGRDLEKLDGHITRDEGLGLLVLVADCFPVALSDGEQVAMLHCGWRPLAGGILEKALERFERRTGGRGRTGHRRLLLRGGRGGAGGVRGRRGRGVGAHAGPPQGDLGAAGGRGRHGRPARRPLH